MGNAMAAAYCLSREESSIKIIYWEGKTRTVTGKRMLAGEIMFEFPHSLVCHADSFFLGHTIPSLTIDDRLKPGQTYFVLPLDIFTSRTLSASSISALVAYNPKRIPIIFKECPFEYIKWSDGRVLIKVSTEFLARIITTRNGYDDQETESTSSNETNGFLCSTPELKKQYEQLIGSKHETWLPKLETISEYSKIRYSPYRLIGLEWKER